MKDRHTILSRIESSDAVRASATKAARLPELDHGKFDQLSYCYLKASKTYLPICCPDGMIVLYICILQLAESSNKIGFHFIMKYIIKNITVPAGAKNTYGPKNTYEIIISRS